MKKVFIYQIIDCLSENVLQNFIGPNDRFAESVFLRFLQSDGMKNVDMHDLILVACNSNEIFESYNDYAASYDDSGNRFVAYGNDVLLEAKNEG